MRNIASTGIPLFFGIIDLLILAGSFSISFKMVFLVARLYVTLYFRCGFAYVFSHPNAFSHPPVVVRSGLLSRRAIAAGSEIAFFLIKYTYVTYVYASLIPIFKVQAGQ